MSPRDARLLCPACPFQLFFFNGFPEVWGGRCLCLSHSLELEPGPNWDVSVEARIICLEICGSILSRG
uniref:Uncharacterized protein n=1 Tax=Parascaris equorum TaxID=6256 RepID=A0A914S5G8_PAREQ